MKERELGWWDFIIFVAVSAFAGMGYARLYTLSNSIWFDFINYAFTASVMALFLSLQMRKNK